MKKYNPNTIIGKYRDSLYILKSSPLYPKFINLEGYYYDQIIVNSNYDKVKKKFYNFLSNKRDQFNTIDYLYFCTYFILRKELSIFFRFNFLISSSKLFLEKIEYYPHFYHIVNSYLEENKDYNFNIDVSNLNYKFKFRDPIKLHVIYSYKNVFSTKYEIILRVNFTGYSEIINSLPQYNSEILNKSIPFVNKSAKIYLVGEKNDSIQVNINHETNKYKQNFPGIYAVYHPYYIDTSLTNDFINCNLLYDENTYRKERNYFSIENWTNQL